MKLSLTGKLYWKPDYPGEVMPPQLSALVKVSMLGSLRDFGSSAVVPGTTVTLSSSIGGTPVVNANGDTVMDVLVLKPVKVTAIGSSLYGNTYSVELSSVSYNGSLSHPGDYKNRVSYTVGGSINAWLDTRSVTLSRSGAPSAKIKGAPGVTIDEAKDEWVDVDGTAHGQTRYSYKERSDDTFDAAGGTVPRYKEETVIVSQVIGAQIAGSWSASRTHAWSDPKTQDTASSHIANMPNGGSTYNTDGSENDPVTGTSRPGVVTPGWYDVPSTGGPNPLAVNYTLKDNADGATANAQYQLHLHDEWEHATDDTPAQTAKTYKKALNVPRIYGPQTAPGWTFFDATVGLTAKLEAHFGANFTLKDWLNIGAEFKSEASLEIKSSYQATAPPITLGPNDSALPVVRYIVKTQHKLVDHYNLSGWDRNTARTDGKWDKAADMPVNIQDMGPDWEVLKAGDPAP